MSHATAICTYLPAITQEDLQVRAIDAIVAAVKARTRYEDARQRYCERTPNCSPEIIDMMEHRGACPIHSMYSLLADYREYQRGKDVAQRATQDVERTQPTPAMIQVAIINAYDIKDRLKAADYRFSRDGHWLDFAGLRTQSAWCKTVPATDMDNLVRELCDLGVELRMDEALNAIASQVKHQLSRTTP